MTDSAEGQSGKSLPSFASEFPERFASAIGSARGALEGIHSAMAAERDGGSLDVESLRRYQEIYRLRIELELESAGILWRAAEVTWALLDTLDAVNAIREGDAPGARAATVAGRRSAIVVPRPPIVESERREASTADAPSTSHPEERPGIGPPEPASPPAPTPAQALWAEALAGRRAPASPPPSRRPWRRYR